MMVFLPMYHPGTSLTFDVIRLRRINWTYIIRKSHLTWQQKQCVRKSVDDLFKNLLPLGVQNLIKKQEAVDAEITAHEQLINAVMCTADQLIERQHYAADEIEARSAELQENWDELTSLSAARQQSLQDSLKTQQVRNSNQKPLIHSHIIHKLRVRKKTKMW